MRSAAPSRSTTLLAASLVSALAATPALGEQFVRITDGERFRSLVEGRELTRFGISLEVTPGGRISGSGFGYDVTGQWQWREGLFCRDMAYGDNSIAHDCQVVAKRDETLRFVAERGDGDYADFDIE